MVTKIRRLLSLNRILALIALVFLIVLSSGSDISIAQAVTQGYSADSNLQRGMIVNLHESDSDKVVPATIETTDRLHGVVVNANDAPVTLSDDDAEKVFVATFGKYDVLVSDQNGSINPGDYIVLSALSGIGMKAGDTQPYVIGKALEAFDGQQAVVNTSNVDGRDVNIGRVRADIQVARNPLQKTAANLPDFLRRAAENVAGKPVNTSRVYLSMVVFFVSTAIAASLLYGAVKAGIISVGRNPLSKKSILRSMFQVLIVGLTIFISGLFGVYLLLRL